ncbi:hypothetical protein P692DRAFT_20398775 [Suillus brevipes Sb2]|jgi:hypothetical protein|nr:hypothetical protein P692DRAFT_20398775 [Suillus brevipes Sb2]
MSNNRSVTACLVSFTPNNGFVDLNIPNGPLDHQELWRRGRKYFSPEAEIKEFRVTFGYSDEPDLDEQFDIIVLYDHKAHGTRRCPYLAFKLINKEKIVDVERDDYMAVIKAIDL